MGITVCTSAIKLRFNPCPSCYRQEDGSGLVAADFNSLAESGWPVCPVCGDDLEVSKHSEIDTTVYANSVTGDQAQDMADPASVLWLIDALQKTLPATIKHPHMPEAEYRGEPYYDFDVTCPYCKRLSLISIWQVEPEPCRCGRSSWGRRRRYEHTKSEESNFADSTGYDAV